MNEIEAYLSLPDKERLYSEGLALFKQYGAASRPEVWNKLKVGPMGRNKAILEEELGLLELSPPTPAPSTPNIQVIPAAPKKEEAQDVGEYEYQLLTQKRKLLQERMQHSQSFHDCDTDQQRAQVCDNIEDVNKELDEIEGKMAYVRRYKKLPPAPELKTFILANTDEELAKEQHRCRSNILKVEKRIEHLLSLPENSPQRAKLPAKQQQLQELVIKVELIVQKRKKLKNDQQEG